MPDHLSYDSIGWLVVGLSALCVTVNQMDDFFDRRKPRPGFPPVEQLENSQRTLALRVDKLEDALTGLRREMREDRETQAISASERTAGIYQRIDGVRTELSANLENVRRELTDNQRSLPNEIVALLKNTNAI